MKPLVFHDEATDEYNEAAAYYAARRSGLDKRFRADVVAGLRRIRSRPKSHPFYPGTTCRRVRTTTFSYKLVYLEEATHILVLPVHHDSRQPGYWLHRLNAP